MYDADTFKRSLTEFRRLRPNGVILVDLAYVEMVDTVKARSLAGVVKETGPENVITTVSMSKLFGDPRLRMAAVFSADPGIMRHLQAQWQTVFASHSNAAEIEALGRWIYVKETARRNLYSLFTERQDALLHVFVLLNANLQAVGKPPRIDMTRVYRDVPLYVYAHVNGDFLELFEETGILGVPGSVFGDDPARNMVRFSVGIEDLQDTA